MIKKYLCILIVILLCVLIGYLIGASRLPVHYHTTATPSLGGCTGPVSIAGIKTTDQISNVSVNGVINIRTYGASGSIQTMTCTASSGRRRLLACSGGDFKLNQFVRIARAGLFPTISTPGAPTLSCSGGNGASCRGSVVYGYQIAAIQGRPNGTITPAGSAQTITQAAQSPFFDATYKTTPFVSTTVSWTAVTSADYYVVYKNVAGGAYNFYTAVTGTGLTDYGTSAQIGFGCTDFGVPCTAPSSATPNDVFGQITSATGSSYTISADPLPPKYNPSTGLTGTYPSAPSVSGTVTVYHDDTPAFQGVYNYLIGLRPPVGNVTIEVPSGDYNVYAADPYGGHRAFNVVGLNWVTLQGDGWSSRIHQIGSRDFGRDAYFIWSPCGFTIQEPPNPALTSCLASGNFTSYALSDPAKAGARSVTLSTPANASHLFVGEYVQIAANTVTYPGSDWTELNRVTQIDSVNGILYLQWPLDKTYSASLPAPYSECVSCPEAPIINVLPNGPNSVGITLRNFWYEGAAGFVLQDYNVSMTLDHLYVHSFVFDESGYIANKVVTNNTVWEESDEAASSAQFVVGAAGSRDIRVNGNRYIGDGPNVGFQWCQEGTANVVWSNNQIQVSGYQESQPSVWAIGQSINCQLSNNQISVTNSNFDAFFVWGSSGPWMLAMTGNQIHIDRIGKASVGMFNALIRNTVSDLNYLNISKNTYLVDTIDATVVPVYEMGSSNGHDSGLPTTVRNLPTCPSSGASETLAQTFVVTDSTAVATEGQACAGGSSTRALAICGAGGWRCF